MAEHKLAILVSAVGAAKAAKELKGVDASISRIGAHAGRGIRTAASNLLKLGAAGAAVGAGLVAINVKSGVQSLATLESAVTSVDGAIRQMGQTGKITGAQVAAWANDIEAATGAAFDDKDITAATANLIRYGKVVPANLRPAMAVMTDLAVKTGDVKSASSLLGKVLADPTKAAGKLSRMGIVLTKQQQKQIAALVKGGKAAEAQAYLLDVLAKSTKGAAAASQGPYERAMATMADATEDAQRALAIGFLPVIQRAADWIKGVLADPATLNNIKTFGTNLAGAFDNALTFIQKIPWDQVGNGLKTAADWAGRLFSAFTSMPPEVQATIIGLAGLNKLSGGAITSIVGELGKGLIKGVLGMTAGVVNINAGVVRGGGGGGIDVPGGAGGAIGGAGVMSVALAAGSVTALGATLAEAMYYGIPKLVTSIYGTGGGNEAGSMQGKLGPGNAGGTTAVFEKMMGAQLGALTQIQKNTATGTNDSKEHAIRTQRVIAKTAGDTRSEQIATNRGVAGMKDEQAKSLVAFRDGERASTYGLSNVASTTRSGTTAVTAAQSNSASRIVSAVQAAGQPQVNVYVSVPGANVRYGSGNGSKGPGKQDPVRIEHP